MMSDGLLPIKRLKLPKSCALEALDHLRKVGRRRVEGVALWAGVRDGADFHVRLTIVPQQYAGSVEDGLIYVVPGEELHRISILLYEQGLTLAAQIHSHPTEAFHSDTDDAYPIVTVLGGVSVVVPDFARDNLDVNLWAVFRLLPGQGWVGLTPRERAEFIEIVDDTPTENTPPPRKRRWYWPWH